MTRTMTITITTLSLGLGLLATNACTDQYRGGDAEEQTYSQQEVHDSLERSREHVDAAAHDALRPDPMMAPGDDPNAPYPGYQVEPSPGGEGMQGTRDPLMVPPIGPPPATGQDTRPNSDAGDAMRRMGDAAVQTKDQFVSSMRQRLGALEREIDAIDARTDARSESMKAELRETRAKLEKDLEALGARTETAFENARDTLAKGLLELEQRVDRAHEAVVEDDDADDQRPGQPDM